MPVCLKKPGGVQVASVPHLPPARANVLLSAGKDNGCEMVLAGDGVPGLASAYYCQVC